MDRFFNTPEGAELIERAHEHLKSDTPPSISALDRRMRLGYAMAARILTELERRGVVSAVLPDGTGRRYLGEGDEGRRAFERLAAEINAGIEPAAHWWRRLSPTKRRAYLPGVDESAQWADLSERDKGRLRLVFARNREKLSALRVEFDGVWGVAA